MPLWSQDESIDNLTEVMILGYFESIKGVFITKWLLLVNMTDATYEHFVPGEFDAALTAEIQALFPVNLAYNALANPANEHMVANFVQDIATTAIISAWCVFEQLIKHLAVPNYAHDANQLNASYQRAVFGLSHIEKDNLNLFYYIRNAIVHYNGAYFAATAINHSYNGQNYVSIGHEGEKISILQATAWRMINDIEAYSIKAYQNWLTWKNAHL